MLYISEGIPYGFATVAMITFMRQQGMALDQIGVFSAVMFLPWSFKWAWAPLIDLIRLDHFGGRRAWILMCTAGMIITLVMAALVDFQANFQLLLALIFINNMFCATQDVAIDSLAVSTLKPNERGRGNGFMFGGQYFGITLGGGVAVFVYGFLGLAGALAWAIGLLILSFLFALLCVRDPHADPNAPPQSHLFRNLYHSMIEFVQKVYAAFWKSGSGPMVGVLFSLLPCGAMALAYATLSTIQVDYGLNENQIAELRIYNTIASALGCLAGGMLGDRYGTKRVVTLAYFLTALPTAFLGWQITQLGLSSVPQLQFYGLIILHGLFFGMAFGVRNAIFMGMTSPAVAATQFTAFMGMSNLAISLGNYWQGFMAERFDYSTVLYIDSLLAVLIIGVIPFLRERESDKPT
jgi:PAT family beta-lactamase induction signal transducer AmpG